MKRTSFKETDDKVAFKFLQIVINRKAKKVLQTGSAKEETNRIELMLTSNNSTRKEL